MHFARNINYCNIASSIQPKSKERIRTIKSEATTRPKVDVVGEKVQSVVVAFGLDRLPQKLSALISLVWIDILKREPNLSSVSKPWLCQRPNPLTLDLFRLIASKTKPFDFAYVVSDYFKPLGRFDLHHASCILLSCKRNQLLIRFYFTQFCSKSFYQAKVLTLDNWCQGWSRGKSTSPSGPLGPFRKELHSLIQERLRMMKRWPTWYRRSRIRSWDSCSARMGKAGSLWYL